MFLDRDDLKNRFILILINFFSVKSEIVKPSDGEVDPMAVARDQAEPAKESAPAISSEKSNTMKEAAVKSESKTSIAANGEHQNNNIEDSKNTTVDSKDPSVNVKKEKKPTFEEDDPFAALDWKDGIATLPGN